MDAVGLLNFVLSNCSWEDGKEVSTFRQPFDMLAEATTGVANVASESAKSAKTEIWLGNQDSSQNFASPIKKPLACSAFASSHGGRVSALWTITVDHSSRRGIAGTPMPPWAARAWAGHETASCRGW